MRPAQEDNKLLLFILALQEAFVATVPFFVVISLVTLVRELAALSGFALFFINADTLKNLLDALYSASSLVVTVSVAYFIAQRIGVHPVMAAFLATTVLVTVSFLVGHGELVTSPRGYTARSLIVPILSAYLLRGLYPLFSLKLPPQPELRHVYRLIDHWPVFLVAFFAAVPLYVLGDTILNPIEVAFFNLLSRLSALGMELVRTLFSHLFWFIGLHGPHTVNAFLGKQFLLEQVRPNLTWGEFNRLFVNLGGSGVGLALWAAFLWKARTGTMRTLARLATPFVFFNIDELLIYGGVVFNRILFVPFVLLPLADVLLGYAFVQAVPIEFSDVRVPWITPVFVNAYLKTGGDLRLLAFQLGLVIFNALVYGRYVERFSRTQRPSEYGQQLSQSLHIKGQLLSEVDVRAYAAQRQVIDAAQHLDRLIPRLREENLTLYYQPIVALSGAQRPYFEALLRYRSRGKVSGPTFLGLLEKAGLAPIVDVWVARRLRQDLERFHACGLEPKIGLNLHPDTLANPKAIKAIAETLKGLDVTVEILERSFLYGERAEEGAATLRQHGLGLAIDDYGTGYSNLEVLVRHEIAELKVDRTLTQALTETRGYLAVKKTVELCHELGIRVVAEGVETEAQLEKARALGVDFAQGFYFAPALPLDEACAFFRRVTGGSKNGGRVL